MREPADTSANDEGPDHGVVRTLVVGNDIVSVARIERWLTSYDDLALELVFTPAELAGPPAGRAVRLAVAFGVKESVGKALGTGLAGIDWRDVQARCDGWSLTISVTGAAARRAHSRRWHGSWARSAGVVHVVVIGET